MKLVFDFGGVLFDWRPVELLKRELPGRAVDDAAARHWAAQIFQGYGGDWGEFDRGTVAPGELVERIARRTGLTPSEVQAVIDAVPAELQPVPATVALLGRLRAAGAPLYYLSNMPAPYADHLEAEHEFVGWFRAGVFSSRVQAVKPEPGIFALAAERFDARPEELLFFDDHLPNVLAARAAGWQALPFSDAVAAEVALRERAAWVTAPPGTISTTASRRLA
jgi:putative hydrolase of the HAD superfamily